MLSQALTRNSSVGRILDTIELLEFILGNLPFYEIIACQRVNLACRTLIRTSPSLRESSWYRPRQQRSHAGTRLQPELELNPFLILLGFRLGSEDNRVGSEGVWVPRFGARYDDFKKLKAA